MKKLILIVTAWLVVFAAQSQQRSGIQVEISKDTVKLQGLFKLSFSSDFNPDSISNISFPESIQLVSGPNRSNSTTYKNGEMSSSQTINYLLKAIKPGTQLLPSITFYQEGQTYVSESVSVTISNEVASEREQSVGKKSSSIFDSFFNQPVSDTLPTYRIVIRDDEAYLSKSRGKYGKSKRVRNLSEKEVKKLRKTLNITE